MISSGYAYVLLLVLFFGLMANGREESNVSGRGRSRPSGIERGAARAGALASGCGDRVRGSQPSGRDFAN